MNGKTGMKIGGLAVIAAVTALLWPGGAIAEGPNWTFLEAGYQRMDVDDPMFDYKPDGFVVNGSFAFNDNFFMFGSYGIVEDRVFTGSDLEYTAWDAGLGYNVDLTENTDMFVAASYVWAELDDGMFAIDDDGYGASLGIRSLVNSFDLGAAVEYVDFGGQDGDDVSLSLGAAYFFNDYFAACLNGNVGDDVTSYGLALRFAF